MKTGREGQGRSPAVQRSEGEDDEYARGFADGSRVALREVISYVGKGHTASEIKLLAETKLAHVGEDSVEYYRNALPRPQRIPVENLLPGRQPDAGHSLVPQMKAVMPGFSYLFSEESPNAGRKFLKQMISAGLPTVIITRLPQNFEDLKAASGCLIVVVGNAESGESGKREGCLIHIGNIPNDVTGPVNEYLSSNAGQIGCYLETVEYFVGEAGFDLTLRLVHWLSAEIVKRKGVLAVSVNPEALDRRQQGALRADFNFK